MHENNRDAELSWLIESPTDWIGAKAIANQVAIEDGGLVLEERTEGTWTSRWHDWQDVVGSATKFRTTGMVDA